MRIIFYSIGGKAELLEGIDSVFPYVVAQVRLPRILTAAIVGAGLSMAGMVFQGILLNPLADPYTLGISFYSQCSGSMSRIREIAFFMKWISSFEMFPILSANLLWLMALT